MKRKNIAYFTLGCKLNFSETSYIANKLEEEGYNQVSFNQTADYYVIHTCTVTQAADRKSRQLIRKISRKNPEAVIVAMGCYAQVKDRKKGQPVRFVYDRTMTKDLLNYLTTKLEIETTDALIPGNRYHNFKDFINFPNIKGGTYEYKPITPLLHPNLRPNKSILNEIKRED
ncbi:unnamed protein product, partial [marine sediment metagenome]